jgi:hypothetical protein
MVMTEARQHVAGVQDRMPVILRRADWGGSEADPQGSPAGWAARRGGAAVPALSGADGGGADGGELGAAVMPVKRGLTHQI